MWLFKGDTHYFRKEYDHALKCAKIAIQIMPDSPFAWFCQGFYHMGKKDYNLALESFDIAIFLRKIVEYPLASDFKFKGKALIELGRLKEAYSCFQEALKLDPGNKLIKDKIAHLENKL